VVHLIIFGAAVLNALYGSHISILAHSVSFFSIFLIFFLTRTLKGLENFGTLTRQLLLLLPRDVAQLPAVLLH